MDIIPSNMALATQVLERQQAHAEGIRTHLSQYAHLTNGDLGLILQLLQPINEAVADTGELIAEYSGKAFGIGAEKMTSSREAYIAADRAAYEAAQRVMQSMGGPAGEPYSAPNAPTLGAANDQAPSRYGEPDGNLFNQAFWDGYSAAEWMDNTAGQAQQRSGEMTSSSGERAVAEAVDASSFLTTPQGQDPFVEDIRWSAGLIFGAVDWMFAELAGYSLLEEVTKPFSGDWERVREASMAWKHAGDATNAISQNAMALVPPMASWTGKGSEAFLLAAAAMSQAHATIAGPAGTISTALKVVAFACKETAKLILKILKKLEKRLMTAAAMAAVPGPGWVAAAVAGGFAVYDLLNDAKKAYDLINKIYDLVSGMAGNVSSMVDSWNRMSQMYEGLARAGMARI